jgi:hypothetical protein
MAWSRKHGVTDATEAELRAEECDCDTGAEDGGDLAGGAADHEISGLEVTAREVCAGEFDRTAGGTGALAK